ncbi:MAG: branched-chain amino acid transport system II carrier protein [Chlamydiales bacterium]
MQSQEGKASVWSTGLAMFAMFFGAGNIVFPLTLGQFTQDNNLWGVLGLLLTAVVVPLVGLFVMLLFEGSYTNFFKRIGKVPGFILVLIILAVIGPFAGVPRCVTISYSTLSVFKIGQLPGVNLVTFSLLNCLLIYIFSIRPTKILSVIGNILTPILLASLSVIILKGIFGFPHADPSLHTKWESFSRGFLEGYNTMDLLATFFFSSVVLLCLRSTKEKPTPEQKRHFLRVAGLGGLIAALLLISIYVSFCYLAAGYSSHLVGVPGHELLGVLAFQLLGPYAGLFVGIAVFFACLTTEIALATIFARFLSESIFQGKISYRTALLGTLAISLLVSTLRFDGIAAFLSPILQLCYPALIILCILNLLHKAFDFKPVKLIFYGAIAVTLLQKLF